MDQSIVCVKRDEITARFGKPVSTIIITDGGGTSFVWLVNLHGQWQTYVIATFRHMDIENGCTDSLYVFQSTALLDNTKE